MQPNELTYQIIGAAMEVHRELGPGKPEAAYEHALAHELNLRHIAHQAQKPVPVVYKGVKLECGYRLDLLAVNAVVIEVKSVEVMNPVHRAQVLTYLKLGSWQVALLLNFNVAVLKEGIERLVFGLHEDNQTAATRSTQTGSVSDAGIATLRTTHDCGDREAERLAQEIIAGAMEVHRELGPGLLPSAYEACLCHELHLRGTGFERKRPLALSYKGTPLPESDEVELLIGGKVVMKPRALASLEAVHEAELVSQLRMGGWRLGLLLNFNTVQLSEGIRRVVLSNGTRTVTAREQCERINKPQRREDRREEGGSHSE